jgi:hypothetical protein
LLKDRITNLRRIRIQQRTFHAFIIWGYIFFEVTPRYVESVEVKLYASCNSELMELSDHCHALATLPWEVDPEQSLDRGLGLHQSLSGYGGKVASPAFTENLTVIMQPVATVY